MVRLMLRGPGCCRNAVESDARNGEATQMDSEWLKTFRGCAASLTAGRQRRSRRTVNTSCSVRVEFAERLEPRLLLTYATMVNNGPSDNRVDMVFLGDGYTASEIDTAYVDHINLMLNHTFGGQEDPYPRYASYFNVHRINTISNESGADKGPEGFFADTAFDANYYCSGIERLLCISNAKVSAELTAQLAGAPFTAEIAMVTVNDSKYGGSGGTYPVYAGGNSAAAEIALHELGHSFNNLADEYFSPGTYSGAEPAEVNVSKGSTGNKWSHWLGYDQPGIGVIGAYEGARYFSNGLYRPSSNSKMRSLGQPFDAVSREKIILDIYDLVDPLDDWRDNQSEVVALNPELWVERIDDSNISLEWRVDGNVVDGATGESFRPGDFGFSAPYTVTVRAWDPTPWVRINLDQLEQSVTWNVTAPANDARGVTVSAASGNTSESGAQSTFTVVLDSRPTADVTIPVASADTTEGTVSPTSLTFTQANWDVRQTVTVTGVDDTLEDGHVTFTVELGAAVGGNYAGFDPQDVSVLNVDDENASLDIDDNGIADAATDGILILRYLFGFRGNALVSDAIGDSARNRDAASVELSLESAATAFDADANGIRDAATDGILILRYLFGFRGSALTNAAVGPGPRRATPASIAAWLDGFVPPPPVPPSGRSPIPAAPPLHYPEETQRHLSVVQPLTAVTDDPAGSLFDRAARNDLDGSITASLTSINALVDTDPAALDSEFESFEDWLSLLRL